MLLLSFFFLIVIVGGGWLVWHKYFKNEDQRARSAQDKIIQSSPLIVVNDETHTVHDSTVTDLSKN